MVDYQLWKTIPEYSHYQVSRDGRVRRGPEGKDLKPRPQKSGYVSVSLSKGDGKFKNVLLHRLVARAFVPNPNALPEVNHADGVKANCAASNLKWSTHSENQRHAIATGLRTRWGKGVSFYKKNGNWRAYASHLGKVVRLGYFPTEQAATEARQNFIKSITGENHEFAN